MKTYPNMPSTVYENQLADAIYLAEGGDKTRHPYGILGDFEQPAREICINTIRHRYNDWVIGGCQGDFVVYLANFYCPVGADNDPSGLNSNWIKNVTSLLRPCSTD